MPSQKENQHEKVMLHLPCTLPALCTAGDKQLERRSARPRATAKDEHFSPLFWLEGASCIGAHVLSAQEVWCVL